MAAQPERHGRRSYDREVPPEVLLAIDEATTDTRHKLYNDITALAAKVEAMNLIQTREHAEVKAAVAETQHTLTEVRDELRAMGPRLARVETNDAIVARLDANRRWLMTFAVGFGGLLIAVLIAVLQH